MAKAMACEYHFVYQYCAKDPSEPHSGPGDVGNAFHAYRAAYTDHLVAERKWQDIEWVYGWLNSRTLPPGAWELIEKDGKTWSINPDTVRGSEMFLSVGASFEPLEMESGLKQGTRSQAAGALLSGTIDTLILDGKEARIIDAKSAHSATTISEVEASIYCCLVFAHFPHIVSVTFAWDFVRLGSHKSSTYFREELPGMQQVVTDLFELRGEIAQRVSDGDMLRTDLYAGLCPYCTLLCPRLVNIEKDTPARIEPLQDVDNARRLAGMIYLCEKFLGNAKPLLKDFIAAREDLPGGQLQLGGNFIAENTASTTRKLPLADVLHSLGLGVVNMTGLDDAQRADLLEIEPKYSPLFDVPLKNLEVRGSALKGFAKTQRSKKRPDGGGVSREGLAAAIEEISPLIAKGSILRIRRIDQALPPGAEEEETEG